jgi:Mor family transcriptional regulator
MIIIMRRIFALSYKNGKDILPPCLLSELQKYIQGELIYIPREENERMGWGEANGTRNALKERNHEICRLHREGTDLEELISRYNLSEDSIRKIVVKMNKQLKKATLEG